MLKSFRKIIDVPTWYNAQPDTSKVTVGDYMQFVYDNLKDVIPCELLGNAIAFARPDGTVGEFGLYNTYESSYRLNETTDLAFGLVRGRTSYTAAYSMECRYAYIDSNATTRSGAQEMPSSGYGHGEYLYNRVLVIECHVYALGDDTFYSIGMCYPSTDIKASYEVHVTPGFWVCNFTSALTGESIPGCIIHSSTRLRSMVNSSIGIQTINITSPFPSGEAQLTSVYMNKLCFGDWYSDNLYVSYPNSIPTLQLYSNSDASARYLIESETGMIRGKLIANGTKYDMPIWASPSDCPSIALIIPTGAKLQ